MRNVIRRIPTHGKRVLSTLSFLTLGGMIHAHGDSGGPNAAQNSGT